MHFKTNSARPSWEFPAWEFPTQQEALAYLRSNGQAALADRLEAARIGVADRSPWPVPCEGPVPWPLVSWGPDLLQSAPLGRRTLIMGIVNVTPDSFSDGGLYLDPDAAIEHGLRLVAEGADILDVGGESTRPGAEPVDAREEMRRVLPVVQELARRVQVPISIDTSKAVVAEEALAAGARIVNDITALRGDERMAETVVRHEAGLVLMHMQGTPRTMQVRPHYTSVMGEIIAFLQQRLHAARESGVPPERIWVDPGIGFGKNLDHNLELLRSLRALRVLERPVLLGMSRKTFIGQVLHTGVEQRLEGTAAVAALAVAQGVDILRVHDVGAIVRVTRMSDSIVRGWKPHRVILSLGSNLGNREEHLQTALRAVGRLPGTRVVGCSSIYETAPVGVDEPQPPYLNMTAELQTDLDPFRLLRELLRIEADAGRKRGPRRWEPRPLDLDILLVDDEVVQHPRLTVPHPRMHERAFVLVPLREMAPGIRWQGKGVEERLQALERTGALAHQEVRLWGPAPRLD